MAVLVLVRVQFIELSSTGLQCSLDNVGSVEEFGACSIVWDSKRNLGVRLGCVGPPFNISESIPSGFILLIPSFPPPLVLLPDLTTIPCPPNRLWQEIVRISVRISVRSKGSWRF